MKMKNVLIGIFLVASSISAIADNGGSVALGVILGSVISSRPPPAVIYAPPAVVYQQPYYQPPIVIQQAPAVVISPSQAPFYDSELHGYCSPYQDYQYSQCIDNQRRRRYENSFKYFR